MSFIGAHVFALGMLASILAIAACESERSRSASGEPSRMSAWQSLPPDYNRGPPLRNFP
jgi:hypothetical protein